MRIFIALPVPEEVIRHIQLWQKPLRVIYPHLRWVKPSNIHMTLRFFGDVNGSVIRRAGDVLESWRPGVLSFQLSRMGSFGPPTEPPRVLWLGGRFPEALGKAAGKLGLIPDGQGNIDKRRFLPHITVARNRGGLTPDTGELDCPISGEFTRVSIFSSVLKPHGPAYSELHSYDLRQDER